MECRAYGNPEPEITWYKNAYKLSSNYRRYIREGARVLDIRVCASSHVHTCGYFMVQIFVSIPADDRP